MKLLNLMLLCAWATVSHGYKILFIVPMNGKSHWNYMQVFAKELLHRGHEVTCITSISMNGSHANYTEILIDPPFDMLNVFTKPEDIYEKTGMPALLMIAMFPVFMDMAVNHSLSAANVQQFIHRTDLHFDLIINEDVYHDAFLMFGHKFNAPIVTICPFGLMNLFDSNMGLITPMSHVPHTMLTYTDKMDFFERWNNALISSVDWFIVNFIHFRWQDSLANKHFGHLGPLPSVKDLRKNISIIFSNAHRSITPPRPSMPGLIYIGGAHIKPPKPLPDDLQTFMNEATHGVIYFSLGTNIQASKMPKDKLNIFIETLGKLKQRVIWKFDDDSVPNLPKNVMIRKWLPQSDLLPHPNLVLFITHGGMFSNFEALKYGKQLLVIPFMGDQYRNAHRVDMAGYGKFVDFRYLTKDSLLNTLNEMLYGDKYSNRAKEVAAIMNANPNHPMDDFIWWTEYVIKFRGAAHLKSVAIDMPWFTYLSLDILLFNITTVAVVILAVHYSVKKCCCRNKSIDQSVMKKKQ